MKRLRALWTFLNGFVIGDDPRIAAVVVVSLGFTAALNAADVPAWWVLPVAVAAVLSVSVLRATSYRGR